MSAAHEYTPPPAEDPRFAENKDLPSNIEFEQALLGALLYDNSCLELLPDYLMPEHFYEPFHGEMFRRISLAVLQGKLCDPILLHEQCQDFPAYQELGGLGYLVDLIDHAPPGANAKDYALGVHDLAMRRGLIRTSQRVIKDAMDSSNETPALKQIEQAELDLYGLAETGSSTGGSVSISTAFKGVLEQVVAAVNRDGDIAGLSTGLIDLDKKLGGMHPSNLIVLAARPSMGKTSLAVNIALNVTRAYTYTIDENGIHQTTRGGRVLFYSLEMSEEELARRVLSELSGVPGSKMLTGDIDYSELGRITDAAIESAELPLEIDPTGGISITKLTARARRHKRAYGLDLIVVDYLQLVAGIEGQFGGRTVEVSQVTQGLKALAKELNVPVIALSQLSRKVEERDDKRPQLADLRESGSIEQDADAVLFIYREHYYLSRAEPKEGTPEHLVWEDELDKANGKADVIIAKQRHGPIGTVKLAWNGDLTLFGNLARDSFEDF